MDSPHSQKDELPRQTDGGLVLQFNTARIFLAEEEEEEEARTVVSLLDVTERKKAEEEIRQSHEKYEELVNSIDGIVWEADARTFQFSFVSKQAERILGYPAERWITEPTFWKDHIHPDDREWGVSFCVNATAEKKSHQFEYRMINADGRVVWLNDIVVVVLKDEQPEMLRGVMVDITERKRAEEIRSRLFELLKASEEQYRTLFEESKDAIYISTPEGRFLDINPAGVELFGYETKEDLLEANIVDLYVNPNDRLEFMRALDQHGFVKDWELTLKKKNGERIIVLDTTTVVRDQSGHFVAYRGIVRDVTQQKTLQQQLIQSQKLESLGTLASGIAHDFNNILGIILGYSTLLDRLKLELEPEKFSQSIEAITKATQRGVSLVKQLLTFARKTDVLLESIQLNDAVKEVSKLLSETFPKLITISLQLEKKLPSIVADATQLHQVLLNLCVNARDAMPSGGTLTITTHREPGEVVRTRFPKAASQEYVALSMADTGIGMDEATRSRIFEPFFTTKELGKGTGLGLSLVFGIMESHNGFIAVDSAPGKGTAFHLYFPVVRHTVELKQVKEEPAEAIPGGNETILVVEDEEMLRELVKTTLEAKGYRVLTAGDGEEAVETYRRHQAEIRLVLCNMGLPKLSGYEVYRKLKKLNPNIRMALASGYVEPGVKSEILNGGVKDFIQKPYSPSQMLRTIRSVLDIA